MCDRSPRKNDEKCLKFIFFSLHSEFYDGHEAIIFHGMVAIYKNILFCIFGIVYNMQSNSLHKEADQDENKII